MWQPRPGAFAVTVVCKATYLLAHGAVPLAPIQEEPHAHDVPWGDDPRGSVRLASDMAPFKRRAEVLLVGHAYAPGGQAVPSLRARLLVGTVDKTIAVFGDRFAGADGSVGEPARFTKMPIRWERAAYGADGRNPVGVRMDGPPDRFGRVAVPNLQPPEAHVLSRLSVVEPVGLGPLAPWWPGRAAHLHRHAAGWDHARWNERPLPDDVDAGYFNAAPPDQQMAEIPAGVRLFLENLHPESPRVACNLLHVAPSAVLRTGGGSGNPLRLRCDTLCVDTDRGIVTLTWRGAALLDTATQGGEIVVTTEAGTSPAPPSSVTRTAVMDAAAAPVAPLPFAPASGMPSPLAQPSASPPQAPVKRPSLGDTASLPPGEVRAAAVLPFASAQGAPPAAPARAPEALPPPPPLVTAAPEPLLAGFLRDDSPPPEPPLVAPPPVPEPPIVPAAHEPLLAAFLPAPEPEPPAPAPPPEPPAPAPPPGPPPLPVEAYPIERCAGIAASLARRKEERAATLEENELSEERWAALDRHWAEVVREASARGKTGPLQAYDDAYVARLEAERGDITVQQYAALMVAAERGTEADALASLGLPRGALLRIQRVWLRKMVERRELGKQVRDAIEAARDG
jgi:hypothetical protein